MRIAYRTGGVPTLGRLDWTVRRSAESPLGANVASGRSPDNLLASEVTKTARLPVTAEARLSAVKSTRRQLPAN
jgi:hypothetical protein